MIATPRYSSLRRRQHDLKHILGVTRDLGAPADLDPLLERIGHTTTRVLDCERASVFLLDSQRDELYSRFATGEQEIRIPASRGIAGETCRTGRIIHVSDPYTDSRFNPDVDRSTGFRTNSILSCPLRGYDGSIFGVLQALNKRSGAFNRWDRHKLGLLRSPVEVAVQRQLLLDELAEKERIRTELITARKIQQRLMPKVNPSLAGYEIAGWNQSADETGGDCYDFVPLADGSLAIAIADAVGHGIAAALVISAFIAMFRTSIMHDSDIERTLLQVNNMLAHELPDDRFITAFVGQFLPHGQMRFTSAGQGPILLYRRGEAELVELPSQGLPLGIEADAPFEPPVDLHLNSGDVLALFTDGFFQWAREDGEQFGVDRLCAVVRRVAHQPATRIIRHVHEAVQEFAGSCPQNDDLTAVIVKRV